MSQEQIDLAWKLIVELRKELVELQRLRSQVIGFKITFVSAGIGVIAANTDKVPIQLLVIPAFAAIFFDLLITSHSNSIKRIGSYCRNYLESTIREISSWPKEKPLWEEFLFDAREYRQNLALLGNVGITGLAIAVAVVALFIPFEWRFSLPFLFILAALFIFDIIIYRRPEKIATSQKPIMAKETK